MADHDRSPVHVVDGRLDRLALHFGRRVAEHQRDETSAFSAEAQIEHHIAAAAFEEALRAVERLQAGLALSTEQPYVLSTPDVSEWDEDELCPAHGVAHRFEFNAAEPDVGILYAGWFCECGEERPYDAEPQFDTWAEQRGER
jgi:hypothetical protein